MEVTDTEPRSRQVTERPTKSLLVRTGLMAWTGVLITLCLFIALVLPEQDRMLLERLESTAEVMATSID